MMVDLSIDSLLTESDHLTTTVMIYAAALIDFFQGGNNFLIAA
jgi:hypothetical protein